MCWPPRSLFHLCTCFVWLSKTVEMLYLFSLFFFCGSQQKFRRTTEIVSERNICNRFNKQTNKNKNENGLTQIYFYFFIFNWRNIMSIIQKAVKTLTPPVAYSVPHNVKLTKEDRQICVLDCRTSKAKLGHSVNPILSVFTPPHTDPPPHPLLFCFVLLFVFCCFLF